jgi:Zn-dependent M16 (insulinase) family peptidase
MPLADVLSRTAAILDRLEAKKERPEAVLKTEADLPPPNGAEPGTIEITPYPLRNESQPSPVAFVWPASRDLDPTETLLMDLFLENIAGDATTNLYKLLIDSSTRTLETGARSVFAWTFTDPGQPFAIGLVDVSPDNLDEESLKEIRSAITAEIARVAALPDGSPELAEFQKRMRSRVVETRRELSNLVNSPPRFGSRGTGSVWMEHLHSLAKTGDFRRSVTMKPQLAEIESRLSGSKNVWTKLLADWKITGIEPFAIAAKPSAALMNRDASEREARLATELARLKARFDVEDDQEAIGRYKEEYDATTAELDAIAREVETPKFLENPPLSLDEGLQWKTASTKNGVPLFSATFDTMTSATTSLMIDLGSVSNGDLFLLSIFPSLLTEVGVIVDGKPVSYEEMSERMRNEILGLDATFSTDFRTGRAELLVRGSGNDASEARRAVDWMQRALASPDWRTANLPRILDVVDQAVGGLRNRSQGSEESWVTEPAEAYRRQDSHVLLATSNFLTRAHNAHRLKWLLRDAGDDTSRQAFIEYMDELYEAADDATRDELSSLVGVIANGEGEAPAKFVSLADSARFLPGEARQNVREVGRDLDALIADLPDSSLRADWRYLVRQMKTDLLERPVHTLERLDRLRKSLLRAGDARMVVVGSAATQKALAAKIDGLAGVLVKGSTAKVTRAKAPLIRARLTAREPEAEDAWFVGLVAPQLKGGVFLHSSKGWSYLDRDRERLLDYLASRLYAGGGAHGIFMKTWGAGLAYSNGFRGSLSSGTFGYYAERTPELPQTMQFVIDEIRKAKPGDDLVEYAIALAFGGSRAASRYESRALAMADDLVDGLTPDVVAGFRKAILDLRYMPDLHEQLTERMKPVYATALPGLGGSVRNVKGGSFFVIGNEKQLEAWEQYLKTVEGPDTRVWRLYPRDFWME